MRRHLILGLLLALVVILGSWGLAHAQEKSLYWQRWDVDIDVQQNSDMHVKEDQEIVFTSGTFRFGFRAIPLDRVEDITDVQVSEIIDGVERPYTPGSTDEYGFTTSENDGDLDQNAEGEEPISQWSAYNVTLIPLAAGVFYPWLGVLLSPVFAAAAMGMSSVTVVSNALRLRRFRPS